MQITRISKCLKLENDFTYLSIASYQQIINAMTSHLREYCSNYLPWVFLVLYCRYPWDFQACWPLDFLDFLGWDVSSLTPSTQSSSKKNHFLVGFHPIIHPSFLSTSSAHCTIGSDVRFASSAALFLPCNLTVFLPVSHATFIVMRWGVPFILRSRILSSTFIARLQAAKTLSSPQ